MYGVLDNHSLSTATRDVERSLGDILKVCEKLDSYKRDLDGRLREVGSALSSLERATDERVREVQRNAGKASGYGGYSSFDSNIRSERRKIDGLLDKINYASRGLDDLRRSVKSASGDILSRFEKLQESHRALSTELDKVTGEAETVNRRLATTSRELDAVVRKREQDKRECRAEMAALKKANQDNERKLLSRIEDVQRNCSIAAAVTAFTAAVDESDDHRGSDTVEIAEIRASYESRIEELEEAYKRKIASLSDDAAQKKFELRIKRLSDLLEEKKVELRKRNAALEGLTQEMGRARVMIDSERRKTQLLADELSHAKDVIAKYEKMLKWSAVAHLGARVFGRAKRLIVEKYLWIAAVIVLLCFAYILWGLLAEVE